MNPRQFRPLLSLVLAAAALGLVSCASIDPGKMVPDRSSYGTRHNGSVAMNVGGGSPGVQWFSGTVTPEQFEEAVRQSLERSKLFRQFTDKAAADYLMSVNLNYAGSHPGFDMTAWVNASWTVSERATGRSVWSKEVKSEGSASMDEELMGPKRNFMALERAVKANIESALSEVAALKLNAR